ncbi:ferredoxin family protein [Skermania sp. ID1734]|uniref:4Fe-4S dicluster domain-containing protein n=1 Tax=Skermania sp. ID1734 TaxID=2597516 RepID=UPI00117FE44F|nr:ferredoxin family protein [Skermania sp. ID1734]TSE01181.1 ferredoxin family protein [Skermania sp. ID1734]
MPFVIAAPCVADYSCLEVCPADCIRPRPDDPEFDTTEQLYIDATSCIDCEACVPACPVQAVYATSRLPAKWAHYASINAEFFEGTQ